MLLAQNIKSNYDEFVKILDQDPTRLASTQEINIQLKTDLFKIGDETQKILLAQESPLKTYTDTQGKIVK
jgi:hypothetical protein